MRFNLTDEELDKPTEKQLELIADIEEFCKEKFDGETIEDASEYIDRNMQEFKLNTMDNWQYQYM